MLRPRRCGGATALVMGVLDDWPRSLSRFYLCRPRACVLGRRYLVGEPMKDRLLEYVLGFIIVGSILTVVISVERFRWNECRRVGHSVLYCLSEQSK